MYPIAITTYNRYKYLTDTLSSLESTIENTNNVFLFDDCSNKKEHIDLLVKLESKYKVFRNAENMGTVLNTVKAIEYMYNNFDTEYMIITQDDVLYSKIWFTRGIELLKNINIDNKNIAYLCLFNKDKKCEEKYYIMECGHPGLITWIINRKFWKEYRKKHDLTDYMTDNIKQNEKSQVYKIKNIVDYKLSLRIYKMGWFVAKVGRSLVQHVGDISSLHNTDMSIHRSPNFVGG